MNRHFPLYVVVSISGAAVLAIEILGTRILGPYYGVGLFLWSALITVTLAALSLGYLLGGRWADRGPRYSRLALILTLAGIWLLAVPILKRPLITGLEPLGLRPAVLAAAALLFFVPLAFLGMVSPYAIRLRAHHLEEVGRSAGDIYAVSTVASVVAALLTGFVLIPSVGVSKLLLFLGVFLIAGALVAVAASQGSKGATVLTLLVLLGAGVVAWRVPGPEPNPETGLVAVRSSPYADIRVMDHNDVRYLLIDGGFHSAIQTDTGRNLYPYVNVLDLCKYFYDTPGKMLLVGLGGGSVVKSYNHTGWDLNVVEIDPVVEAMARKYFGLDLPADRIHTMDGRRYLATCDSTYDLVVVDAFGSSAIPFQLVTREAFGLIRSRMKPDGILAMNVLCQGWHDVIVRSLGRTLGREFEEVEVLPMAEPPNTFGNVIILASNRKLEFPEDMLARPRDFVDEPYWHDVVLDRNHAWNNRFRPDTTGVPLITDDLNPVDPWSMRLNEQSRRVIHGEYAWSEAY